jgi:hypothetical protein
MQKGAAKIQILTAAPVVSRPARQAPGKFFSYLVFDLEEIVVVVEHAHLCGQSHFVDPDQGLGFFKRCGMGPCDRLVESEQLPRNHTDCG